MPCSDLEDRETAAQWNTVDVDEQREKHYTKNGRREKAWKKQVKEREGVARESQQKRVTRACERRTKSPGRGKRAAWFGREGERSDEKKRGQREAGSVVGGGGEWNGWTGERPAASLRTTWPHRPCRHHSASPASFQRLGLAFQPANSSPTGLLPDRSPASLRSRFASSRPIVPESSNRYSFSQPEQIHSLISCSSAAAATAVAPLSVPLVLRTNCMDRYSRGRSFRWSFSRLGGLIEFVKRIRSFCFMEPFWN